MVLRNFSPLVSLCLMPLFRFVIVKVLTALGQVSTTQEAGLPASSVAEAISQVSEAISQVWSSCCMCPPLLVMSCCFRCRKQFSV